MRQRLTIILTFVVIIGLLVILNTFTYVKEETMHDLEIAPNRSTYHSGPTGTRALHDLLSESGYKVMRWREKPQKLLSEKSKVSTFVVVGQTRVPFDKEDVWAVLEWVAHGGQFVLIDREINRLLLPESLDWRISSKTSGFPTINDNPSDAKQMTEKVVALQPVQPTVLTRSIQNVLPSRFAARLKIEPAKQTYATPAGTTDPSVVIESEDAVEDQYSPVVHIADTEGALLIDYSYGDGRIVILGDPFMVANAGIGLNDNLQLAINTIAGREGLIAFDEYHQGRGINQNAIAGYFAGTPVIALAAQVALIVLLILWSKARRFGRALPLPQVDRRSSLEFVASMAELQERSKAYDLAIENIYTRTRRVLARYAGLNYNSSRSEIASSIAARSNIDAHKLETLMRQCEETINGEPINWRRSVDLVRRLREVERQLGLGMRSRDVRQAAENI